MNKNPSDITFPQDFIYGVATAAYQIEGAHNEDGRKPSIWDAFSKTPGRVYNGDTGDTACDHYHRWAADLDLITSLQVDAYRFSIAWPRIFPNGTGKINSAGMAFYDKLIDGCLERGIKPFATLYHWDLPIELHGHGGWTQRTTALAFANYAETIATHFGDRLAGITTLNEPWCSAVLGYLQGIHAPGEQSMAATVAANHHLSLAHGLGVQAIKAQSNVAVGIALNLHSVYPTDSSDENSLAAQRFFDFHNGAYLDPMFRGSYPESYVNALAKYLPPAWQSDLATIHQPLDYWGLNYYTPARVFNDPDSAYPSAAQAAPAPGTEITDIGWEIEPQAFSDIIRKVYRDYSLPACYITENGACYNDEPVDGEVNDQSRINYLNSHLQALSDVTAEGLPIKGYFAWSLMDNFEWAEGYKMRFGLVHVDYQSQLRTVKASGQWYGALAGAHRHQP